MSKETIGLDQFIRRALELRLLRFRVCLPGQVVRYDAALCRADVKPMLPDMETDSSGAERLVDLQIVNDVPVMLPRGGGFSVTHPLKPGDLVTLLFADKSMDGFLADGRQRPPEDPRTHDLNDAIAIPGLADFAHPPPDLAVDHMSLGPESPSSGPPALRIHLRPGRIGLGTDNPAYSVALAEKVLELLQQLKAAIQGALPTPQDGGAALKAQILTALEGWPTSVASTKVKVKE